MGAMEPGIGAFIVAVPLWVLLTSLPGFLLATSVDPTRTRLERWAVAPALSIAVGFAAGSVAGALGMHSAAAVIAGSLVTLSLVCGLILVRRPGWAWHPPRVQTSTFVILGSVAAALLVWCVALATSPTQWYTVLPNIDGNTHGIMVSRILQTGSIDWRDVTRADLAGSTSDSQFYVLGLHALVAVLASVTNVPAALVTAFVVGGSLSGVLGVVALGRRLLDGRSALVAGVMSAVLVPWFPAAQMAWGILPLVTAVALVPAVAVVVLDVGSGRRLVLPVLALAGLFAVHVTEVLVVGLLVGMIWALGGELRGRASSFGWAALAGIGALLVALPTTLGLLAGGADRLQDPPFDSPWGSAVLFTFIDPFWGYDRPLGLDGVWLTLAAGFWIVLAVVGCRMVWRARTGRGLVTFLGLIFTLSVVAEVGTRTVLLLPWYSNGDRLTVQLAALLPLVMAAGWTTLSAAVRARFPARRAVAVLGALGLLVGAPLFGRTLEMASSSVSHHAVVTAADRAAFGWLSAHARPGERVLNDNRDGSVWMYDATRGAAVPMFGGMPGGGWALYPAWAGRIYLRDNIARIAADPAVQAEAARWSVRYVMVGERTIADARRQLDATGLESAHGLRLVFASGAARVYEIVRAQ